MEVSIAPEAVTSTAVRALNHLAVDELNRRYGGDHTGDEEPLSQFADPDGFFLVARDNGHIAGGVAVRPLAPVAPGWGEIKRLWVRPDLRRHGVAAALLAAAEKLARERGLHDLFLETGWAQPEAIALYHRERWTKVDVGPGGLAAYPDSHRFVKAL